MDINAALEKLRKLDVDGAADMLSAIESRITGLETNNYQLVGEKRAAAAKASAYESSLKTIATALEVSGDLDSVLGDLEGKAKTLISDLATTKTAKTEAETKAAAAETTIKSTQRSAHLQAAAAKAGANLDAFKSLIGDLPVERIVVADSGVEIAGEDGTKVAIADYATQQAAWLVPALFSTAGNGSGSGSNGKTTTDVKLPNGGPNGKATTTDKPGSAHVKRAIAKLPTHLKPKS